MTTAEAQAELKRFSAPDPVRPVANPSNRRFRTWGGINEIEKTSDPETAYKAVEVACNNVLVSWTDAQAAILFGSRARGSHAADSDWDIAFITSTGDSMPKTVHQELNELKTSEKIHIHGLAISQNRFHENADSLGNVIASIAREGRLIAGHCEWPETESVLNMKPNEYENWRSGALEFITLAAVHLEKSIDNARRSGNGTAFKFFVKDSSDAAEYFAKIAFGKLASGTNEKFKYSHTVNTVVQDIEKIFEKSLKHFDQDSKKCFEKKAEWWLSDHGREFLGLLNKMNGHGHEDHLYGYEDSEPDVEVVTRAANRLVATISFAIREVEEVPGPAGLRQVAQKIADVHRPHLLESVNRLQKILQDIDLSDSTFSAAGPVLYKSVVVAANFGEEIAQGIALLANSLNAEPSFENRANSTR